VTTSLDFPGAECDQSVEAGLVVNCAGLVPDLDDLDLEAGGVTVNEFLQSVGNLRVYSIGNACEAGPKLVTVADLG